MSIPRRARALQITAPGSFELVEVPMPQPASDEVLIEVEACSTCTNWELCMWEGRDIFARPGYPKYPLNPGAPGHEAAGRVISCGDAMQEVRVGDLVAVKPSTRGHENDAHATHITRPENEVVVIPEGVPAEEAAPLEMAMCAIRSVELAKAHLYGEVKALAEGGLQGLAVIVVGLGPAGILHLQVARAEGASPTVGVDPLQRRREAAAPFADAVFAPDDAVLYEFVRSHPNRVVFECSGASAAMSTAMSLAAGAVHVFGVPDGTWIYDQRAWCTGTAILPYHWRGRQQVPLLRRAARLLAEGKINTRCLISAVLPYHRYAEGMQLLKKREALKIIFRWH
jgi:2-desacetyl-2-hydroxyethyl bacteriochlorophyllide A dehydrogenase